MDLSSGEPLTVEEQFDALPEEVRQKYLDLATTMLHGFLWCDKVWEAWSYGYMTQDNFSDANSDPDVVREHAISMYKLFLELK